MFANGPGDLGSIPGRVILKTFKMVLDTSLLNTQQYKVRIEGKKLSHPGKGVAPSPTSWCSSYWKGSLLVALVYVADFTLLTIYIYIYIYIQIHIYKHIYKYTHIYSHTQTHFFFIIQRVKARAMPCPQQPPTRGDTTVSVAQGGTATPVATKQLLPPGRVLIQLYIYIYIYTYARLNKSRDYIGRNLHF